MKGLLMAQELLWAQNARPLEELVLEFEEYTGQKVPKQAIDDYKFCGLNHIDFFTSDFLNNYGIYSLLQMQQVARRSEEECYKKALELCLDISPAVKHTRGQVVEAGFEKGEVSEGFPEGYVLPAEFIFYEEGIRELIRFCKGLPDVDITIRPLF